MACCRPDDGQSRIPACETFCLGEDEIKLPCVRKRRFLAGLNAIKTFLGSTLIGIFSPLVFVLLVLCSIDFQEEEIESENQTNLQVNSRSPRQSSSHAWRLATRRRRLARVSNS